MGSYAGTADMITLAKTATRFRGELTKVAARAIAGDKILQRYAVGKDLVVTPSSSPMKK